MVAVNVAAIAINIVGVKQCFKEGTLVACLNENGEEVRKPIETVAVGTLVLAYDEEIGEKAYKKVVRLFRNETYEWYHIFVNDEEIVCTGGHPFYSTKYDKFIAAKDLETDDKLLFSNGEYGIINHIEVELLVEPQTTYNFEVEDYHTYYVGENEVLVHNRCDKEWGKERRKYWKEQAEKYKSSVDKNNVANSGKYKLTDDNIKLMSKGKAPIGLDNKPVNLHHVVGIETDPFYYVELTMTEHFGNFKALHPWLFKKG